MMLKIIHRSTGYVDHRYYEEKSKLMSKRIVGECIICHAPIGKGKRFYCGDECFQKWFSQFGSPYRWAELRSKILERDAYRCVKCGKIENHNGNWCGYTNLVVDHIIPIALGGSEWDEDNLQTLCTNCNQIKTSQDIKKIAKVRKILKDMEDSLDFGFKNIQLTLKEVFL